MPLGPTTSSSGNPAASLRLPLLSDGGPLGREEDRCGGLGRDAPSLLMAAGGSRTRSGLSELIRASISEDMMISCASWAL